MSKSEVKVTEKMYDTLIRPVITEKAMKGSENGQVVFTIPLQATKKDVKDAVEALYGVKVKSVNTIRVSGKTKRSRGIQGVRSDYKKAIVTLADGQNIDITTGI